MSYVRKLLILLSVLCGLYLTANLLLPLDPSLLAKHNLTPTSLRVLNMAVALPIIAIWYTAFYGFAKIRLYSQAIRRTNDGKALFKISEGLLWLAFSLPIRSVLGITFNTLMLRNSGFRPIGTIILNYISVAFALIGFMIISRGANILASLTHKKANPHEQHYWTFLMIILSVFYTFIILSRPADSLSLMQVYYLPNWLILTTLAIPYLYAWYRGFLAAYHIYFYSMNVKGTVYRRFLVYLSVGFGEVIVTSVIFQLLVTLSSGLNKLRLTPLLFVVYSALILLAIGYVFIAVGAKKLRKIEEV